VQRILSLATLGVLGGLVWMFLRGGGLNQLAAPTDPAAQQLPGAWNAGGGLTWPSATRPTGQQPAQPALPPVQPASSVTAPPPGVGPTIRIASFNIQVFGQKKAGNEAVMTTLIDVIRQFQVVAIQEIRTQDEYFMQNFVALLNRPLNQQDRARNYQFIIGPRLGDSDSTEQYAYVFDADRIECSRTSAYTVGDPDNLLQREPYVATFRTSGVNPDVAFTFTLINVHTTPEPVATLRRELDSLAEVYRVVRRAGGDEDDVIMLGDFNADDSYLGRKAGDSHLTRLAQIPEITPLIHGVFTNTRQNKLYDNIIIHQPSTTEYAGHSGVYDIMKQYNLPLALAEQVSDHFPVWAEFSVYERDYAGRIASRGGTVR
jgi:deoxyribonuclease-1-like protein